jgi:hypothetical protein
MPSDGFSQGKPDKKGKDSEYTVTFRLGDLGVHTSGELQQTVLSGEAASAPMFTVVDGWVFSHWSEDFSDVTADLDVNAEYAADMTDHDGDGLSCYDEAVVYLTDPNQADTSGDGFSDGTIVGLGCDPNVNYSALAQLAVEQTKDLRVGARIAAVEGGGGDLASDPRRK